MEKVKLPNPCPIKCAPEGIPAPLCEYINKRINRINEILSDPLKYQQECKEKEQSIPNIGIFEFNETDELNKFSNIVEPLMCPEMVSLWNKVYKLNQHSLPMLFIFIMNTYHRVISKKQHMAKTEEQKIFETHMTMYHKLQEDPTALIAAAEALVVLMDEFNGIIRPDGADCFEEMDVTDAENQVFLINGEIPYHIDWDMYITDAEYDTFMMILHKIVDKLNNRKLKHESEYLKSAKFVENPKTRKKEIVNAPQIFMMRLLYVRFIDLFKKPHYKEIAEIISVLFEDIYTEDDIIKLTKPVRDKIKFISQEMKKNGFTRYYDSLSIENQIYEQL